MIGTCSTTEATEVRPEKYSPMPIKIISFGNRVLGPTRKLKIPQSSTLMINNLTGWMNFVTKDIDIDIVNDPATKQPYKRPCIWTEFVNSAILKDNTGSK